MLLLISYTLLFASILYIVAMGGAFSEHSGVINLGLEGVMTAGALGGALVMRYASSLSGVPLVLLVLIASLAAGIIYSALLGVACVSFSADQTLVGTAMNMLALAGATVFTKSLNLKENGMLVSRIVYIEQKKSFMITPHLNVFVIFAVLVLAVSWFLLSKTRFGLRLRACGENPHAAASVGINVIKMRWYGVLISGALGGLGGIAYIVTAASEWQFENGVSGFGFLALAVMIFGQWDSLKIMTAALVFGFFRALSSVYSGFSFLEALNLPGTFYNVLPYVISLLILVIFSRKSHAPKAEGIPYK